MRKTLGGLVFLLGVGGLGVWGAKSHAVRMETEIAGLAGAQASGAIHAVTTSVAGRDITVRGLADTQAEKDALLAGLNGIEGRRVVIDEIEVLPVADPFSLAATRKEGRTFLQGHVPTEKMREAFAQSDVEGADGLTLASGAPERWELAAGEGLAALDALDEGAMSLTGQTVRLSGVVDLPADRDAITAALSLPEGYTLDNAIETRDDGKPVAFNVLYSAAEGASVTGKLPAGYDVAQIAGALGLQSASGTPDVGLTGSGDAATAALEGLKPWLAELETAAVDVSDSGVAITGEVSPGADPAALQNLMTDAFGDEARVRLTDLAAVPASGATRTNQATGEAERFTGGFWLPDTPFTPSLSSCGTQSDALLERAKITFLSGSADLDPRALRAVNAMAAVVRRCVSEAGLVAEIGGHTDNTGSGNFQLSADRAVAVQNAMIARGVPAEALTAVGYGASKPIADNSTEAGRAANRRTTVRWAR